MDQHSKNAIGTPEPEPLMIDETGDEQASRMEELRARYSMYWDLRNREQTRDITLETLSRKGLIRTINELENQVMTERANGEYWERAGREARAHSRGAASEVDRLRALCDQGATKIDDLYKECAAKANAAEGLKADLKKSREAHELTAYKLADAIKERDKLRLGIQANAGQRVLVDKEYDDLKAKVSELEQTLSIVRGDLATANNKLNARSVLPKITLPSDWLYGWNEEQQSKATLQAKLGAAAHRAKRAERKAAKANTELDAMRKHAMALADSVRIMAGVSRECRCKMCTNAFAAIDYLKQTKK